MIKLLPKFFNVHGTRDVQLLEQGLREIEPLISGDSTDYVGGLEVNVWFNPSWGSKVFPVGINLRDLVVENGGPESKKVRVYVPGEGGSMNITLDGPENIEYRRFQFQYQVLAIEEPKRPVRTS